jgi:hypothetical protein
MTSLKISIPPKFKVVVKKGSSLSKGALLAEIPREKIPHIALHDLLNVNPAEIRKYLVKKVGEEVAKGEIIAKKRGVFSTTQIKSPVEGIFSIIESMPGFIEIRTKKSGKIVSPVAGIVNSKTDKSIIIETEEEALAGENGEGDSRGELIRLDNANNLFKIGKSVDKKIVFGKELTATSVAKIKVLGGVGVVITKKIDGLNLPYIIVRDVVKLDNFIGEVVEIVDCGRGSYLIVGNG